MVAQRRGSIFASILLSVEFVCVVAVEVRGLWEKQREGEEEDEGAVFEEHQRWARVHFWDHRISVSTMSAV